MYAKTSAGDLLLNEKQNKPFVSLNNEVTKASHLSLVAQSDTSFIFIYM